MDGDNAVLNPEGIDGKTVKVEVTLPANPVSRALTGTFDSGKFYWVQIGNVLYGPVAGTDEDTLVLLIVVDTTNMVDNNEIALNGIFEGTSESDTDALPDNVTTGEIADEAATEELNTAIEAIEGLTVSIEKTFGTETTKDAAKTAVQTALTNTNVGSATVVIGTLTDATDPANAGTAGTNGSFKYTVTVTVGGTEVAVNGEGTKTTIGTVAITVGTLAAGTTAPEVTTTTTGVKVEAVWYVADDSNKAEVTSGFTAEKQYVADITVEADTGYVLADTCTVTLNSQNATMTDGVVTTGEVTPKKTPIESVEITLTLPVVGSAAPEATCSDTNVALETEWYAANDLDTAVTTFTAGTKYVGKITITVATASTDTHELAENYTVTLTDDNGSLTDGVYTTGEFTAAAATTKRYDRHLTKLPRPPFLGGGAHFINETRNRYRGSVSGSVDSNREPPSG